MEKHERKHIHKDKEEKKLKTIHTRISGKSNSVLLTDIPLKLKITQVLKEMYLLQFFPIPLFNQNYKYIYIENTLPQDEDLELKYFPKLDLVTKL
jgi:hypothetical protein